MNINNQIVKMSNTLIHKNTTMSIMQEKVFSVALRELERINSDSDYPHEEVVINAGELLEYFGYDISSNKSMYRYLKDEVNSLQQHTYVEFEDDESQDSGYLIYRAKYYKHGEIHIWFGMSYLPLLTEFYEKYTRYLQDDFVYFRTKGAMNLYKIFMEKSYIVSHGSGVRFTTDEMKNALQLSDDAYVIKTGHSKGKFNRTVFEKKAINPVIEEINEKSKCVNNIKYRKIKNGKFVKYYEFTYSYTDPDDINPSRNKSNITINNDSFMKMINELKNGNI